jgi:hypothetical protein
MAFIMRLRAEPRILYQNKKHVFGRPNRSLFHCRLQVRINTRVYPKVSGLSHNEINSSSNKHSLRSNIKGYGGKTH